MFTNTIRQINTTLVSRSDFTKILIGIGLMTVFSNIQIPLKPVPITLQTIGVFFIAFLYTPRNAFLSLMSFITLGAFGVPIFAGFVGGPAKIFGPTAGYILAFPIAALVVSYLQKVVFQDRWSMMFLNAMIGTGIIFVFGLSVLFYFVESLDKALALGLYPFILPGLIKAIILSIAVYGLKTSLPENKNQ